ncbi:Transcriptional regulator containing HTH domain,ArsR family [Halapricum desulfuricans]|uniref:Transcriptional regulator containing HTH domain,ArsR family n=1 Tax=Halapricum desulfuricans TaxID=2841257 RepID=A0A897NGJ2_9EURY|nr:helix-turn-helix domain-containing protein [Halapricum desulfuricans]QSG11461.1 Transcriptional regulator containing HTH domain,ArsR family [Halapricum desulfuricans]
MSLLPSKPDTPAAEAESEPRVIGVDSDDADDVISALSSDTARRLLAELHEEPAPPAELADRVDTSLQNAQYHLENLQSAGAVSVVDTAYSEKGREMDIYAPADQPLVIFAGGEDETTGLKAALSRLIGGLGVLGIGSLAVQRLYGDAGVGSDAVPAGNETTGGAASTTPTGETAVNGTDYVLQATNATTTATDTATTATPTPEATDAAAGIEPGLLFFAGGAVILALWLLVWYLR